MKKYFSCLISILLAFICLSAYPQNTNVKLTEPLKTMTWTSTSPEAKALAEKGMNYMLNIETPQAYDNFVSALKMDPNFTVVLVIMSNLTYGETKKKFAALAMKTAADKTDGEKLFASLVDEKSTPESRRETWSKLYQMFPDGKMIGNYYVASRATADEKLKAAEEYVKKFPAEAAMYNLMGYYYIDKRDNAMAKKCFDKYIELYPDGYNPYDTMGEYYMITGDTASAEKYYTMALEKYPFSNSSINALDKINAAKPKTQDIKKEDMKKEDMKKEDLKKDEKKKE